MLSAWPLRPRLSAIVSVCCAVGISAGSASHVRIDRPQCQGNTRSRCQPDNDCWERSDRSTATGREAETGHTKVSKIADVQSVQAPYPRGVQRERGPEFPHVARGHLQCPHLRVLTTAGAGCHARSDVAREIASRDPGVLAIQELGPGRADGSKGTTTGHLRQTISLERSLKSVVGDSRYQLVRTTPYVKPGTNHGTQGTRILYDTRKFKLLSNCPEKTGSKNYNPSCSMNMPLRSSDSESLRRSAAYAKFADRKTGKRFWVVSVHLDDRHSGSLSTEKSYNALRGKQARAVYLRVNGLAKAGEKIIYAGDFNSWATNRAGDAPRKYLLGQGFYDTYGAESRINAKYPTINHYKTTLAAKGVRLDYVMVKGMQEVCSGTRTS